MNDMLFASFRVHSWIVCSGHADNTIHEITRTITKSFVGVASRSKNFAGESSNFDLCFA